MALLDYMETRLVGILLITLAGIAGANTAFADPPGPAYLIEPGGAPDNSVAIDPSGNAPPPQQGDVAPPSYDDASQSVPPPPDPRLPSTSGVDDDPRALDDFAPRLDPYGTWVDDPNYGTIWLPDPTIVGDGFSPYLTSGHWVDASDGRTWASDYPFGDVVFHYGRWVWTSDGWGWIPGYRYAPAWVAWRVPTDSYNYYGWAPVPPDFVWMNGYAVTLSWRSSYYWIFCPSTFLFTPSPRLYVVRSTGDALAIAHHTRTYFAAVPRRTPSSFPARRAQHPPVVTARLNPLARPRSLGAAYYSRPAAATTGFAPAANATYGGRTLPHPATTQHFGTPVPPRATVYRGGTSRSH